MNEEYKVDLSVADADEEFVIDEASGIDCLEQINLPTSQCLEEICTSSTRLHESVLGVSSFLQPSLVSDLCVANTASSLAGGLSAIAESVKPLSALNAVEGITNMSGLLQMQDFAFPSPALTDVLKSDSFTAASAKALTDRFSASLPDPPALSADFGIAVKVALPDPVPFVAPVPVVESIGEVQGVSSLAEEMGHILSDNAQFAEEVLSVTRAASDAVKAIVSEVSDILAPIRDTLAKISEAIKPAFDFGKMISGLFVPIEIPTFCSGILSRIHEDAVGFSEFISSRWQEVVTRIKGLAHWMLLRIMRRRQRKEPQRLQLPWRGSLIEAASKAKIESSRSAPLQLREFIVPLRHALLHKYQRISDDSDDMDDVVFLPYAA